MRSTAGAIVAMVLLAAPSLLQAQAAQPAASYTLVSRDGRRPVPTTVVGGQELVSLDDIAALFQVTLKEDTLVGGLTVTYRGRAVVVSQNQSIASVDGRVVSLPSPVLREGRRWLVPLEFLPRALGPVYDQPIELRRPSRLLILGDVRVPRVVGRLEQVGSGTRATIEVSPPGPVAVVTDGGRVLVRVEADAIDASLPASGSGLIDQMRAEGPATVAVVSANGSGPPRTASTTTAAATVVTVDVAPVGLAALPPPAAVPTPGPVGVPGTLPSPRGPILGTIVIDPGHGGDDVGVRGASGITEKQVTLEVAQRLKALIQARRGSRVVLTREDDRTLTVDERTAVANNNKADLFLSLHVNGAPTARRKGAEVFSVRLDEEGLAARRAADAEAVVLPVLGGASRRIDVIRWDLAQAQYVETSQVLATLIAAELQDRVPMGAEPIQQGSIRVLMGANMPAALVEMAYLTNEEQEAAIESEAFQSAVAQAIVDAIVRFGDYLQEHENP